MEPKPVQPNRSTDAASAYIKSQAHAGWTLLRSRYDDGGYSGGSTDRPQAPHFCKSVIVDLLASVIASKSMTNCQSITRLTAGLFVSLLS
jgi:hypothetical protein